MAFDDVTIVEIVTGQQGMWGVANSNRVPLGGLITLLNARLTNASWRMCAGRKQVMSLDDAGQGPSSYVHAALDYWPSQGSQRTIVVERNGRIIKAHEAREPSTATLWVPLVTGLALDTSGTGRPSHLSVAGAESSGRARKVFFADGRTRPHVCAGDADTMAPLSAPSEDWSGTDQPSFFFAHQGYNWAAGSSSSPHTVYRSLAADHEEFSTAGGALRWILGPETNEEICAAGTSFKGGALIWKYPAGAYFIDTTTETNATNWFPKRVADAGIAGPSCFAVLENDVVWVAPDASWHSLTAVQTKGDIAARGFSYRKLSDMAVLDVAPGFMRSSTMMYDARQREILWNYLAGDMRRLLVLHLGDEDRQDNWSLRTLSTLTDAILGEVLYARQRGGIRVPALCRSSSVNGPGIFEIDALSRFSSTRFEWWMQDTDLSAVLPRASGRYKNLYFVQIEYVPRGTATHTVELWADGSKKQTISMSLTGSGIVLPATLPWTLSPQMLKLTPERKLNGRARRFALRGYTTGGADVEITKVIVGVSLA